MNTITSSSDDLRQAQAWLAGQLGWERVLDGLRRGDHEAADDGVGPTEPVAPPEPVEPVQRPAAA